MYISTVFFSLNIFHKVTNVIRLKLIQTWNIYFVLDVSSISNEFNYIFYTKASDRESNPDVSSQQRTMLKWN